MIFKKLLLALGLVSFSLSCHYVKPTIGLKHPREIVTTIEHYVKHDTDLKCKDVAKITNKGFNFYACESDLNQELIQNFEFVSDIKEFGKKRIDLIKSKNYHVYKNRKSEIPKTNYWLFVTEKFFIPKKRNHWIFIKEKGQHFDRINKFALIVSKVDDLKDEKDYFKRRYDVYLRKITNFAGNCDLEPNFLKRDLADQADTILHEELHMTVSHKNWDLNLEESIACLIGSIGAIEYFKEKLGEDSKEYIIAKHNLKFKLSFSEHIINLNKQLNKLYSSDLSISEKLKKKKEILDSNRHIINNASLWDSNPYNNNFPLLYQVYQKHPNFKDLVKILNKMPKKEKEGIEYLEKIISEDTP